MGQWAVSGVQAISPAQAAMITRPSSILPQQPSNTSSPPKPRLLGKSGIGRMGSFRVTGRMPSADDVAPASRVMGAKLAGCRRQSGRGPARPARRAARRLAGTILIHFVVPPPRVLSRDEILHFLSYGMSALHVRRF